MRTKNVCMNFQNYSNFSCLSLCTVFIYISCLSFFFLVYYIKSFFPEQWVGLIKYSCLISSYVVHLATQFGTFAICAMTFDKLVALKYPHKAASFSTTKRTKVIISLLFLFCAIYNIPHFFITKLLLPSRLCVDYMGGNLVTLYCWFTFVINSIMPLCLLTVLNSIMIMSVRKMNKMFGNDRSESNNNKSDHRKSIERQLALISVLVVSAYLLFVIPSYIRCVLNFVIDWQTSPQRYANYVLFYIITADLYFSNSAINFYLYCISGSKFRSDVVNLFNCKTSKTNQGPVELSSTVRTVSSFVASNNINQY